MSEEIKREESTSEEAFSEEIRRRLAEPGSGKPSLEEFKLMVYKDRERRRKRRNAAVAGIVVALLAGFFAFDTLVPEVGADKNPKEEIVTEDGVIIEDGGWGSSEEADNTIIVVENWENIKKIKRDYPEIKEPLYLPKGYSFEKLTVQDLQGEDLVYKYTFINDNDKLMEIEIVSIKGGDTAISIDNNCRIIKCSKGNVYIQDENKIAIIGTNDGETIYFWNEVDDNEIIKVIDNIN